MANDSAEGRAAPRTLMTEMVVYAPILPSACASFCRGSVSPATMYTPAAWCAAVERWASAFGDGSLDGLGLRWRAVRGVRSQRACNRVRVVMTLRHH